MLGNSISNAMAIALSAGIFFGTPFAAAAALSPTDPTTSLFNMN